MRLTAIFLYLMVFLFSGSQQIYASPLQAKSVNSHLNNLRVNHHSKISDNDQDSFLFEDADLDIEDDFQSSGENSKLLSNKNFDTQHYQALKWYQAISETLLLKYSYFKSYKISSAVIRHSSPIYIKQRVLRI